MGFMCKKYSTHTTFYIAPSTKLLCALFHISLSKAARNALLKYFRVESRLPQQLQFQNCRFIGTPFAHLLKRHFSEEVRGSFLDKSEVTDRVIDCVKNFPKLDPSKLSSYYNSALLSVLALEGIAVCIFCYYWENYWEERSRREKRPTISSTEASLYKHSQEEEKEEEEEVDDTKEDYLSQLPDDVLYSILENLRVRDAARTTILSTRWKYLFDSVHPTGGPRTTLKFNCLNMFGLDRHRDHPYHHQEKNKFKNVLNESLQLYCGDRVDRIEMTCCFAKEFTCGFSHWLQSISRLGVERLHLFFECYSFTPHSSRFITFSLDILSQASLLKHLVLSYCIVLSSPKVHFNSLVTLSLHDVMLESVHMKGIMSSCSNLKELSLANCKLPYTLRLDGTVTMVVILFCYGAEKIDLHAAYLHTIKCRMKNNVRFLFSYVPVLKNVIFWLWKAPSNSHIFGDCARHLPAQVKSLTLQFYFNGVIYFPTIFRNLRELSLMVMTTYIDILEILDLSTLLSACPLLQNLNLSVCILNIEGERRRRMLPFSPIRHTKLKQVTYNGFYGSEPQMKLALYILTSSIVLERMFLSPRYEGYFGGIPSRLNVSLDEGKRNSIQQKLHGQAVSREVVVIIQ